ncbi:MAG: efflux transporter outer membrane subunit [Rhodanobacter sp.]|jgi:NodT family efflux transporter outer membrane factor (OMF) lipoprotein|nr:efflux transporter outer membrane subunit [Rhodanobacter sp.]
MKPITSPSFFIAAACILLSACAVGPDYQKPEVAKTAYAGDTYKELGDWKPAQPADAIGRGAWWEIFGDPVLNDLERQVDVSNQSLAQAEAQYRQARATVNAAHAGYWPTVATSPGVTRSGRYSNANGGTVSGGSSHAGDTYQFPFTASWEPDLWGKVRRTVEGNVANAQASAATLESVRLSLQAELAQNYFQLRIVDEQKRLLDGTVEAYQKSLQLTQNQYNVGVAARADVVQAQTQLKTAQVSAIDSGVQRAQLEHAIALLVGKTPDQLSIAPVKLAIVPPAIPLGVPSQLLERRPDVAAAERQAATANAQIGVAESAWFPSLTLSANAGYQSSALSNWFTAPSRFWSLGPQLAQTLFDGGLRSAQTAQARAAYDAAVANYRETALAAFQNVEDNLAALRILEKEAVAQDDALQSAERFLTITTNQYRAGTVSYLNVVSAQTTAYGNERNAIAILGNRLNDSVALIKALGGGWSTDELPAAKDISQRDPEQITHAQ